ncbi:DUF551 domain-containing protein [Salmonella enterica subsp. enterica]|nr:DUF551 domain-containing protein [Salmonella enterica subsp. enterica]
MTTFTDKELIKEIKERIGSLDVRDNIERRAYEIALASLEADPVAYIFKHPAGKLFWALTDERNKEQADVIPVYAAAPAPVVPDNASGPLAYAYKELTPEIMRGHIAVFERYGIAPNDSSTTIQALRIALDGIERSNAMLNGDEPVSQAYKLPPISSNEVNDAAWKLHNMLTEHGPLNGCQFNSLKECFYEALKVAMRNTPATPGDWISCSERMPSDGQHVIILCDGAFVLHAQYRDGEFFDIVRNGNEFFETQSRNVTDWMPLPEPPEKEHSDIQGKADNQPASGNQTAEFNSGNEWTGNPDIDNAIIMLDRIDTLENCDDDRIEAVKAVLRRLAGNSPVTPDGWVMVPKKLTAENGAKGVLSGEFSETTFISCPECFGDDDCDTCDGSGRIEIKVPVTWTTIKSIWDKGIAHFAAKPPQEVNRG